MAEFNRAARVLLPASVPTDLTLAGMLADIGLSEFFADHVVLPLISIIWSCDTATASRYPVGALLAFLDNHGMLMSGEATRWRTVTGGSAVYVERVAATVSEVLRGTPVRSLRRRPDGVEIRDAAHRVRHFDRVVIAVHPGDALRLLADPTPAERAVLSALPYVRNPAVLHTDGAMLPRRAMHRSSWNHRQSACRPDGQELSVTYYLNRLQNIESPIPYMVTLNGHEKVDPASVLARMDYEHPLYTPEAVAARSRLPELTTSVTAYAGAYHGWGFHEDGCRSGVAAAEAFGVRWLPADEAGGAGLSVHRRAGQDLRDEPGEERSRPALHEAARAGGAEPADRVQEIDRPGQIASHLGDKVIAVGAEPAQGRGEDRAAQRALPDPGRQPAHRGDGRPGQPRMERERGWQSHVEQLIVTGQAAQQGQRLQRSRDHRLAGRVVTGDGPVASLTQKVPGSSSGKAETRHSGAGSRERGDGLVALEEQPGRVLDGERARAGQRGEVAEAVTEQDRRPQRAVPEDPVTGQRERERGHVGVPGAVAGQLHGPLARYAPGIEPGLQPEFWRAHPVDPLQDVGAFDVAHLGLELLPAVAGVTGEQQHVMHRCATGSAAGWWSALVRRPTAGPAGRTSSS
jgi:predicted NAD/FAD-binding protein